MSGRNIPALWEKGWRFPGIGPLLTFSPLLLALELSWSLGGVSFSFAGVLQWACTEAQGLLEVNSSAILDLADFFQFMLFFLRLCPSFLSVCLFVWLWWVFIDAHRLSLVVVSRVCSSCGLQASHCSDFSHFRAWALEHSVFSSCRSWALEHSLSNCGLSCSSACGIFPEWGSNPRLLQRQTDSLPLSHHGSQGYVILLKAVPCPLPPWFSMAKIFQLFYLKIFWK